MIVPATAVGRLGQVVRPTGLGGTGWGCLGSRDRTQENCGVLTAGICTTVTCTPEFSCSSSHRSDEVKPLIACLAPQYADCKGMLRDPSAEPTCTIVPWPRGSIRSSAAIVP